MSEISWINARRKVAELIPADYNPRKMSEKERADLTASLDKFSLADPVIINADGKVIGGHQRLKILSMKGVEEIDVRIPSRMLTLEEEKELNLRLNKNAGQWDEKMLVLHFGSDMLVDVGFAGEFVDEIFSLDSKEDDFNADEEYKKIENPRTKTGDVYVFKNGHRLMCGDSTNTNHVDILMNGELADLIYTDPPYNVDYRSPAGHGYAQGNYDHDKIFNDNLEDKDFVEFLSRCIMNAFLFSHEHGNLYMWFAMKNYRLFRDSLESAGFRYMQVCYWVKERFIISRGWYYHRCYEPCMIGYKNWKKKFVNLRYAKESDAWDCDRMTFEERLDMWYQERDRMNEYVHPTQKPVRLAERALKRNSEVGHIVLDLFGGSGSTLLCCDQLKRKAFLMEMDPKYCDVIVDRYQKYCGETAVLQTDFAVRDKVQL